MLFQSYAILAIRSPEDGPGQAQCYKIRLCMHIRGVLIEEFDCTYIHLK